MSGRPRTLLRIINHLLARWEETNDPVQIQPLMEELKEARDDLIKELRRIHETQSGLDIGRNG